MGALRPGQMLDGTSYRVVREIGAGGMGVVYEIEHVRLKKRYVAKVLLDQIKNEDGALERMEREAQVLAAISHTNIVQVHDFGTTLDGVTYFVMEKLEGVDLRVAMKAGAVTRDRAIAIVADVLDALEHVHRKDIVHRDVKPENVFLAEGPQGVVTKVLDFGIVHLLDRDGHISQGRITKTGGFVGTLYYAAPEQMEGKPAEPANDVYAAGLVLFELIAGKGPFDDDPGVGLSRCFKPAPTLSDVARASRELSDAVTRALERDPARRPTAGALAAELRALVGRLEAGAASHDVLVVDVDELLRNMAPVEEALARETAAGEGRRASVDPAAPPATARLPPPGGAAPNGMGTSPGVYATVDGAAIARGHGTKRGPPSALVAAGAASAVVGAAALGLFVYARRTSSTDASNAPAATSALVANAGPSSSGELPPAPAESVDASAPNVHR